MMKIYIGNFKTYYGPFQIAEILTFWLPKQKDEFGFKKRHDWSYKLGHFFAFGTFKENNSRSLFAREKRTWFDSVCERIHKLRGNRVVKIKIDYWDHWNANDTMAIVILPVLKSLKEHNNSYGWVDDEDGPEHLKLAFAVDDGKENGGWDSNNHLRYEYILDEMIWAFEQLHPNNDWEEQYWSGESDLQTKEVEGKEEFEIIDGPNHTRKWDKEGHDKHYARIQNGLRLFGKYYMTLWS